MCNALLSPLCFTCCPGNPKTPPCHAIGSAQPNELPAASSASQSRNGTDHMTLCVPRSYRSPATNPAVSPAAVPLSACVWTSLCRLIGCFIVLECVCDVCVPCLLMNSVQRLGNLLVKSSFSAQCSPNNVIKTLFSWSKCQNMLHQ